MKITAAPSPRGTNTKRRFLFTARAAAPRSLRVRSILVYCADYHCSHSARSAAMAGAMSGCPTSRRGLCARPAASAARTMRSDFNWNRRPGALMRYR